MKAKPIILSTLVFAFLIIIQVSAQSNKASTGYRYHNSENSVSFKYTKEYLVHHGGYITLYNLFFVAPDKEIKGLKENKRLVVIHYPNEKQIIGMDDVFGQIRGGTYNADYIKDMAISMKDFSSSLVTTVKYIEPASKNMTNRGTLVMLQRVPNRLEVKFKDKSFTYVDMSKIVIEEQGIDGDFDFYELDKF